MIRTMLRVDRIICVVVGAAAIAGIQALDGWWLNSTRGVVSTVLILMVASFLIAVFRRSGAPTGGAVALWIGAMAASTAILFRVGPGTIFPITLAIAAALTATAVVLG